MTPTMRASFALAAGGALWGLYWIPLRWLADLGADGIWSGVILIAGAASGSLVLAIGRRSMSRSVAIAGLVTGAAFGLYSASLLMTDVVRAILLFYLTPVWGTLLGRFLLAERIGPARVLALLSALAGLGVILGTGSEGWRAPGAGDLVALASGIVWAFGTLLFFRLGRADPVAQSASFLTGALCVSLLFLPLFGSNGFPGLPVALIAIPAAFYVLPMVVLTVWPVKLLTPARVGLILMTEVVVGLISAALLAGEPFGPREAAGAALIVLAALIEVVGTKAR